MLATSLISVRTMYFYLDDSLTLLPTPKKQWVCLALNTTVNSYSPKWNLLRVCCLHDCPIITCLMYSFCQPLQLTLILHLFVIANNTCPINELWLLPCKFSFFFFFFFLAFFISADTFGVSFVALRLKRLGTPTIKSGC